MDNKTLLLNIGLEYFSKLPYEAVSVQEIVSKANVTKPTLYHYFGSKLGFYKTVFEHFTRPFFDGIIALTEYHNDLTKNLNEIAKFSLDFFYEHKNEYWLIESTMHVSSSSELAPFLIESFQPMNTAFEQMFQAATEQHGNLKPMLTCWMFQHALIAMIFVVLTGREPYSDTLPYRTVHQFMYGIFS